MVLLRAWREQDTPQRQEGFADPLCQRFSWPGTEPPTLADVAGALTRNLALTCAPDNVASQRVALRCGFVREGVLRAHLRFQGSRRDTMVFSLLPGELRT